MVGVETARLKQHSPKFLDGCEGASNSIIQAHTSCTVIGINDSTSTSQVTRASPTTITWCSLFNSNQISLEQRLSSQTCAQKASKLISGGCFVPKGHGIHIRFLVHPADLKHWRLLPTHCWLHSFTSESSSCYGVNDSRFLSFFLLMLVPISSLCVCLGSAWPSSQTFHSSERRHRVFCLLPSNEVEDAEGLDKKHVGEDVTGGNRRSGPSN